MHATKLQTCKMLQGRVCSTEWQRGVIALPVSLVAYKHSCTLTCDVDDALQRKSAARVLGLASCLKEQSLSKPFLWGAVSGLTVRALLSLDRQGDSTVSEYRTACAMRCDEGGAVVATHQQR
eukprot:6211806-Pleurochrysis_carterae.AAC.3